MGSISISSSAETLVAARFDIASRLGHQAESETFTLIKALVALAKQAAGIDIDATVPLTMPDVPTVAPFADKLISGADGLPTGAETAIWQSAIDRASDFLVECLERLDRNFTGFSAVSSIQYNALLQRELDRHTWHLADITDSQTIKAFEVEAEFAKMIVGLSQSWSLESLGADRRQALAKAELLLKQYEIQIREFLSKYGIELDGYMAAGDTGAKLASSIMQAVSASASISANGSDSVESTATATSIVETRTSTTNSSINATENTETVITGDS